MPQPPPLYPLRFEPILKRLLWGGRRLGTLLDKPLGAEIDYAESWEISDHGQDVSRVAEGPLAGSSLRTLIEERGPELLGTGLGDLRQFPLLVKFLDAHQVLSVQVHPDDERGMRLVGDNGKTEAWIILHAEPGSLIYAGLRPGVTRERFAVALSKGQVEPLLHRFEPRVGDCVQLNAGILHAIGAGIVLAEIQQMSDATFRVFDWDRLDSQGRPRPLHIEHALESIDFGAGPIDPWPTSRVPVEGGQREPLARCAYYALDRWILDQPRQLGSAGRFTIVLGLAGRSVIRHAGSEHALSQGQTLLLPSAVGPCEVFPRGEATVLTCIVPL